VAYPVLLGNSEAVTLNTYYRITQEINNETRMSANAALSNIGGALCSTPQSLADAHY